MTLLTGSTPVAPVAHSARTALASRLRSIGPLILDGGRLPDPDPDPAADAAVLLDRLVTAVAADPVEESVWLVLTALSAAFPTRDEVRDALRRLELDSVVEVSLELLDSSLLRARAAGEPLAELDVVTGGVVVDVDHTARYNLHTGIQRVVRNLMPHWLRAHDLQADVLAVAWTAEGGALRRLTERETERVYKWAACGDAGEGQQGGTGRSTPEPPARLVVPFRSVVVLAEVPRAAVSDRIAALGACSGNRVVGIGYDAIPVVSADMVPPVESTKFVRYLTAVKFASRMAGISAAATAELGGFVAMLPTQGLTGPVVSEVPLPAPATPDGVAEAPPGQPLVLVVGSHEPRKNHLAVLHAAETLWREGRQFTLRFIGGSGWGAEFPRRAADLAAGGRPVEVLKAVDDAVLDRALADASFTVFPSLHEGYGLPVVESLAAGTPVITSDFGSTAEIAAAGGVLTIDPRDDEALIRAMRRLLMDPAALAALRDEIAGRRDRTWSEYAVELWDRLVDPELADLQAATTDRRRLALAVPRAGC